jgi:hypothetical protein
MHFPLQQKLFQLALPDFLVVGPLSNILVGCNQQMSHLFHLALLGGLEFTVLLGDCCIQSLLLLLITP